MSPRPMSKKRARKAFVRSVLAWCERTHNDVLSTFDIPDHVWEALRADINRGDRDTES